MLLYYLIALLTSGTVLKNLRQIGVDLTVHFPCEKIALDRQYDGCILFTYRVTWTTVAESFPRPPAQKVIVRVPIMVLSKIGTFSETCTKNLGHLGKKGDT
jgi:hypothetical protein